MDDVKMEILYGVKVLEPVRYWLTEAEVTKKQLWWSVVVPQYWINCEYSRLGPFDTKQEAYEIAAMGGIRIGEPPQQVEAV